MPSLSFLKSSKRGSQQLQVKGQAAQVPVETLDHEHTITEKSQRRKSTREFFRNLVNKPTESDEPSKPSRWRNSFMKKSEAPHQSTRSPEPPIAPMIDKNKPLPPPPDSSPSIEAETPPISRPAVKLERIISPISPPDLHKLFSGAPQFFARSEGQNAGAPHPSVEFPWNIDVESRDLSDHIQIRDEAWGCITASPNTTVQSVRNSNVKQTQKAHFTPRCHERPNMLSMQGVEKGTIGYAAALELETADCFNTPKEGPELDPELISDHRRRFLNNKTGLRSLTDSMLIERLIEASTAYHDDSLSHYQPAIQLYTELFTQLLYPPSKVTDLQDPYSLHVQIEALIDVLAAPLVWFDFSLVEWRMCLGEILWSSSLDSELGDEMEINGDHMSGTEKYWLLLQILLSCELLLRLDAVSMNIELGTEESSSLELSSFDKGATTSVKWGLILARRWLENIRVEKKKVESTTDKKATQGWLASLTGTADEPEAPLIRETVEHLSFEGRNKPQQVAGLLHFAQNISWPNLDSLTAKIATCGLKLSTNTLSTPFTATPLSTSTQNSAGYFSSRRQTRNMTTVQKNMSAILRSSGWLSSSYMNGLVLPGEGLSHFLIATLLENDETAIAKLGDEANLFGGFVYSGRSFWSTGCVVGRVLASRKGARECMGWISSDVIPVRTGEAWIDIDVESSLQNGRLDTSRITLFLTIFFGLNTNWCAGLPKTEKPRIWNTSLVETRGSVLGEADPSLVLPGDFVVPPDESTQKSISVIFESLDLFSSLDSAATSVYETPGTETTDFFASKIKTYSAMMRFSLDIEGKGKKEANLALSHDVNFVTAHPCIPSQFTDIIRCSTSPSFQKSEQIAMQTSPIPAGHPLHKEFTFTRTPVLDLVFTSSTTDFATLLSPSSSSDAIQSSPHQTSTSIPKVLIIDCTESTSVNSPSRPAVSPQDTAQRDLGSDLEMLGRALCAERGWNALVSRRGKGCVSCAVREAGALGWRVVLRV
ncbi:hypothetical protein HYFRA_00003935 [Hymenoscyphus fraxineus]|uniref:Uncharacterized protein n=1 Tax=Hymenoscyphus fraxineus TaxID=746836 RepID=A0A9N9KYV7_9HELO|nr:hypothetical protein HYFRA_00003935 [Hymenoscyphus fraxineus]